MYFLKVNSKRLKEIRPGGENSEEKYQFVSQSCQMLKLKTIRISCL